MVEEGTLAGGVEDRENMNREGFAAGGSRCALDSVQGRWQGSSSMRRVLRRACERGAGLRVARER